MLVKAASLKTPASARGLLWRLRQRSGAPLDRSALSSYLRLAQPPLPVDRASIAAAHHDLRVLSERPALALAKDNQRLLHRYGSINDAWIARKLDRLQALSLRMSQQRAGDWRARVVDIVAVLRGAEEAEALAKAFVETDVREEARERLHRVIEAASLREEDDASELGELGARLASAWNRPGRARRRHVIDVLRKTLRFPTAMPRDVDELVRLTPIASLDELLTLVRECATDFLIPALPSIHRDSEAKEKRDLLVAELALVMPIGEKGIPRSLDEAAEVNRLSEARHLVTDLASTKIDLSDAVELSRLKVSNSERATLARLVADGLGMDLLRGVDPKRLVDLAQVPDVRAARAYATWVTRLAAHYDKLGVPAFTLSPELFTNLPRNEDLGVLAMCLVEQMREEEEDGEATTATRPEDPIAVLDATLSLFKKLPNQAKAIVKNLRATKRGETRRLHPAFAAWFNDDELLDRLNHLATLAGTPGLSASIREDFDRGARLTGELMHLEGLRERTAPQESRLALIRRTVARPCSPARTRRRIEERIESLLPIAYRRELDATFRQVVRDAWGIDMPRDGTSLVAWRDAVRFFFVADENRRPLRTILRRAAQPSYDLKREPIKNKAWIAKVSERIDVDAWLRPRRREMVLGGEHFVIELEMSPLEVLRMGIPFGTCLSLEGGVNAASTVYNAIDANKRVLYVRNAKGNVVARKLLAISKEEKLIGYNLYMSIEEGERKEKLRAAVLDFCAQLSADVRAPMAKAGEPEEIHRGFWYDDGTVAFDAGFDVAAYCQRLSLSPPAGKKCWLEDEALLDRAMREEDVVRVREIVNGWATSPAERVAEKWLVDRMGPRGLEKTVKRGESGFFAPIARHLVTKEPSADGVVKTIELATRFGDRVADRLPLYVASQPPSPKIAAAIAEMGVRSMRRSVRPSDQGLAHLTLSMLPAMFTDVAGMFDLLDEIDDVWSWLHRVLVSCRDCVDNAIERSATVGASLYEARPDPDVVLATLMSRRRGRLSHRVALRIAARYPLTTLGEVVRVDRALARFAALRPDLLDSPDYIAALLRQLHVDRVSDVIVNRARGPRQSPFEQLRDLLVKCERVERMFESYVRVQDHCPDIDKWRPLPWELAWRRRRLVRDGDLRAALFERAKLAPSRPTLALSRLAQLGDLEKLAEVRRLAEARSAMTTTTSPVGLAGRSPIEWRRTARSLTLQMAATKHGVFDRRIETQSGHVDVMYAELARKVLFAKAESTTASDRDAARVVMLHCAADDLVFDWDRVLAECAEHGEVALAARYLETSPRSLSVERVVDLWGLEQSSSELKSAIAASVRKNRTEWDARVWAAEREAKARGVSVDGLFDRVALGLVKNESSVDDAMVVFSLDQLRAVINAVVQDASPRDAAGAYWAVDDALSASIFLGALARQPFDRAVEIRAAVRSREAKNDRERVLQQWMNECNISPDQSSRFIPKPMTPETCSV